MRNSPHPMKILLWISKFFIKQLTISIKMNISYFEFVFVNIYF